MTVSTQESRRKDARRNRKAILDAARELFAECATVPMCEVARRAGVGQATLYRNFPARSDLAGALLAEQMDRTGRVAEQHAEDPDAFFVLLRTLIENMASFYALGQIAREDTCFGSELDRHRQRLAELIKPTLLTAKSAGTLRRDVTMDDVFLVLSATRGAMDGVDGPVSRASAGARFHTLLLSGLTPPPADA